MLRLLLALIILVLPCAAIAQERATLVADSVSVTSGNVLIASGHVVVFFGDQKLTASSITYDRVADRLVITGPIQIDDGQGNVITADQAELSADLTEGLITSARFVLAQQLQMTAREIRRSDHGRYTALREVVASSCKVCRGNPTPLWEIRASEVLHDTAARQIYFSGATLRFAGVPVIYVPRLRIPEPGVTRATGFLNPRLRSTSALGTGLKLPYFLTLGPSRDLTFTPYFTTEDSQTLEFRYRQAFVLGDLQIDGAVTQDQIMPDGLRGYLAAKGNYDLGQGYQLRFEGIAVSDRAYLVDYGISSDDRLLNQLSINRLERDLNFSARLLGVKSLREGEDNDLLPTIIGDLTYEKRFSPMMLGGVASLYAQSHAEGRRSQFSGGSNGDGSSDDRDLARISLGADWRRNWLLPHGLQFSTLAAGRVDSSHISQDEHFSGDPSRASAALGVELRWPLLRQGRDGSIQTLEPVAQLVMATSANDDIPNGDSSLVEFDESSLFDLERFPGSDAVEPGARANLGLSWRLQSVKGWTIGVVVGRVLRESEATVFSDSSGFNGVLSDWLLGWSYQGQDGKGLTGRILLDDQGNLTKGEMKFALNSPLLDLSGGYEFLPKDKREGRSKTASEIVLAAGRRISGNWHADLAARYDLQTQRLATSGLELSFRNECIDVALSLSRRYAESSSLKPTTDFDFSVELLGFGGGGVGPARSCRQ